jgi:hypothetical protein
VNIDYRRKYQLRKPLVKFFAIRSKGCRRIRSRQHPVVIRRPFCPGANPNFFDETETPFLL